MPILAYFRNTYIKLSLKRGKMAVGNVIDWARGEISGLVQILATQPSFQPGPVPKVLLKQFTNEGIDPRRVQQWVVAEDEHFSWFKDGAADPSPETKYYQEFLWRQFSSHLAPIFVEGPTKEIMLHIQGSYEQSSTNQLRLAMTMSKMSTTLRAGVDPDVFAVVAENMRGQDLSFPVASGYAGDRADYLSMMFPVYDWMKFVSSPGVELDKVDARAVVDNFIDLADDDLSSGSYVTKFGQDGQVREEIISVLKSGKLEHLLQEGASNLGLTGQEIDFIMKKFGDDFSPTLTYGGGPYFSVETISTPHELSRMVRILNQQEYNKRDDGSINVDLLEECSNLTEDLQDKLNVVTGFIGEGGNRRCYSGRSFGLSPVPVVASVMKRGRIRPHAARAEAKTLIALDHSGIVNYLDSGILVDGRPYLIMKKGETLYDHLKEHGSLTPQEFAKVFSGPDGVLGALRYAHGRSTPVYHGDLTPRNILIARNEDGEIIASKVADWESTVFEEEEGHNSLGSPAYMYPLQDVDPMKRDIFGLGVSMSISLLGYHPTMNKPLEELRTNSDPVKRAALEQENREAYVRWKGDSDAVLQTVTDIQEVLGHSVAAHIVYGMLCHKPVFSHYPLPYDQIDQSISDMVKASP